MGLTRTDASGTWTYTRGAGSTTTVLDPANNESVYTFNYDANNGKQLPSGDAANGTVLVEEQHYQGPGTTLLMTKTYCYDAVETGCSSAAIPVPITQTDTYTTLSGMSSSSRMTSTFDFYGNPTGTATYDLGATTATTQTFTLYGQSWNGSTSCGSNGGRHRLMLPLLSTQGESGNGLSTILPVPVNEYDLLLVGSRYWTVTVPVSVERQ